VAPILLEVEPEYQGLAEAFSASVDRLKQRRQAAQSGEGIPYAELEREVAQGVGAIERAAHATLLLALDVDAPTAGAHRGKSASTGAAHGGDLLHDGGAGAGDADSVSAGGSAASRDGGRGLCAGRSRGRRVAAAVCPGDGVGVPAGSLARGGGGQ
jgi:hypothetical protein